MSDFWDEDGDFDYEAHHNATVARKAAVIGGPDLADAVAAFGLHNLSAGNFTPELREAMALWCRLADQADGPESSDETHDQAEVAYRAARILADQALKAAANPGNITTPAPAPMEQPGTESAMSASQAYEAELRHPWQWHPPPTPKNLRLRTTSVNHARTCMNAWSGTPGPRAPALDIKE